MATSVIRRGTLSFTIEGRLLRELGERLVKQPEVALLELIKNSYDADATRCSINYSLDDQIVVADDGVGMNLEQFSKGWMRIGTSAKEGIRTSPKFGRATTGEKGLGRFSVRFLGRSLKLETVAVDPKLKQKTRLTALFDWPKFDKNEDLGLVKVPYRLEAVPLSTPTGTSLTIGDLRTEAAHLDLKKVRTGSIGILTPLRSLFQANSGKSIGRRGAIDPGFSLLIEDGADGDSDVASEILESFVLRSVLRVRGNRVHLSIYRRGEEKPYLSFSDSYANQLESLDADIRFFPRRSGVFSGISVDGRNAYSWVTANAGVAVFDRDFRVHPYGTTGDDWLQLQADAARNHRDPRSRIALKHFPMSTAVRGSTSENWMLRLPASAQLIGLVQVAGRRNQDERKEQTEGLVASADREGFVENAAFSQMRDLVRGAVEAIAYADRKIQQEDDERARRALLESIKRDTKSAINEVQDNPRIGKSDKARIIAALAATQHSAELQAKTAKEREQQLEVMSLLGVVAGFMTHEFGVALSELEEVHRELAKLAKGNASFAQAAEKFAGHLASLKEFVTYSSGYIQGAKVRPAKPFPARPRLLQVKRYFGRYAEERNISVEITAEPDVVAPLVPPSLYNGIALNLYTNALKAVTAKVGAEPGIIAFRAWNDGRWHYLEVSDTGVGIPHALHERVFDPLFTTTESRNDPLGSGMGLGLALIKRGCEAFGGKAELVDPPPNFITCVRVRLPLDPEG